MKNTFIYKATALFAAVALIFTACTKETSNVRLSAQLGTTQALNVTSDSATIVGFVVAADGGFTQKGVCYSTTEGPTPYNSKAIDSLPAAGALFSVRIGGLNYATKYYAKAYAINSSGTFLGDEVIFTTLPVVPTVTTTAISAITGNSASSGGNVTVAGGATVTARGVCYGITHNPSVSGSHTTDGAGTGTFISSMTSLKGNTLYYVRAYATNSAGSGYGAEVSFTTNVDLPAVTTAATTSITKTSAVTGGSVTYDGGGTVTARGIVWGLNPNPALTDNVITSGAGTGTYVDSLTNLSVYTTYHVRAYATNSAGTAYGADVPFTTLANITKFWVVGTYNGWSNTDAAMYIISTPTSGGEAQGYVYLTAGSIKLTTDHSWDNAHTFGDADPSGTTGVLSGSNGGNNITVSTSGYYLIMASLTNMTYSLTATVWGIIGDATAGGWGSQTNMNYNATTMEFWLGAHLTAGTTSFKFRGTSDWAVNYGANSGSDTLIAGGSNISVASEGDYAITMNLSQPNNYSYSANQWGLIGDATPGGWSTDTFMTWDPVNMVFTATLNMLASGSYKFRANAAWTVNFGGSLSALTQGGANLTVPADGNYTITLDPWNAVGTITQNSKK
ncbi:MAG: SusF/SusE family outer membrane protein [Bacteroidales bacterium]